MNVEESGAPVSMQYKEALKEYQEGLASKV